MSGYRRWFRLPGSRDAERDVDEELEAHVSLRVEALVGRGLSPEAARAEALARLGDRRGVYASARDRDSRLRRSDGMDGLGRDVQFAVRRAIRSPASTLLSLLTFGLAIGLSTAGFAVVDHVLIRGLPFPGSERLVALEGVDSAGRAIPRVAAASWRAWREHGRLLESSALHDERSWTVSGRSGAFRVSGQAVVGDFFATLGVTLRAGRAFEWAEVQSGERLAVVSERLWRSALGGRADLPLELRLDGRPCLVVGVVAEGSAWPAEADLWLGEVPAVTGHRDEHTWINWSAIGRLAPGATTAQAASDLSRVARSVLESNPRAIYAHGVAVVPIRDYLVGDTTTALLLLMGAVGLILLIACSNLAGLGLARAATRAHEMAVRTSLGAGRRRLVRQLLVEHLVLAGAGGLLGIALAAVTVRVASRSWGSFLPRAAEISLDWRILAFAIALTLLAGVAAGVTPALRASSALVGAGLRTGRGLVRGGRGLPGAVLVAVEVGLALLLVTGGGLLARSFRIVVSRDLGFRTEGVVTARIALASPLYNSPDQRVRYWERLRETLSATPGVERAGFSHSVPANGGGRGFIEVAGRPAGRDAAGYRVVSDDYLDVLGIPVVRGRGFADTDAAGSMRVVLINGAMARRFWPDRDPIGERVRALSMEILEGAPWLTVIGVVSDVRHRGYENEPEPEMFVLYRQVPSWASAMVMVARGAEGVPASATVSAVERAVRELDPEIAADVAALEAQVDGLVAQRRFALAALGGFALLSLVLAAIGIYGMLSFAVARRTREIGIRAALGAGRPGILGLMLRTALAVVAVGMLMGGLAAFWLTQLMRTMLVEIEPRDPLSFSLSAAVLLAIATAAAALPAWRAARIDPLEALRSAEA